MRQYDRYNIITRSYSGLNCTEVSLWQMADGSIIAKIDHKNTELPQWVQDECLKDKYHAANFVAWYLGIDELYNPNHKQTKTIKCPRCNCVADNVLPCDCPS